MKYSKELHEHALTRIHDQGDVISFGTPFVESLLTEITRLTEELAKANRYIEALENEPVRSQSVIKRLRIQTGMEER